MTTRRDFLALAGAAGVAVTWPLAARAQQQALPTIGYLNSGNEAMVRASSNFAAYQRALADAGFVEGRNVAVEYRWTDGDDGKTLSFLNDLIQRPVSVLAVFGIIGVGADASSPFAKVLFASGIPAVSGFPPRPGQVRLCREPRPPSRKPHRRQPADPGAGAQAAQPAA